MRDTDPKFMQLVNSLQVSAARIQTLKNTLPQAIIEMSPEERRMISDDLLALRKTCRQTANQIDELI